MKAMYRSILTLNTQSPSARRDLRWPYEFYRTLERCKAFSGLEKGDRVLFCYEGENRVVVQSPAKIQFWNGVARDYIESIDTEKIELSRKGELLDFQLVANPIIKEFGSGRRVAVYGEANQLAWLARQGMSKGFGLVQASVVEEFWAGGDQGTTEKAGLPVFCVTFQGTLLVTDEEQFAQGVERGIGLGKMHGLGLLQYAPHNL